MPDTAPKPEEFRAATALWRRDLDAVLSSREILSAKLLAWLESLGLHCNPFDNKYWDAGADPFLSSYLVGHDAFRAICQDQPTISFAPVGGGKTAFRVRLARACRVGEGGRRILPVVYTLPKPQQLTRPDGIYERHLHYILRAIAVELLFALAYHPDEFSALRPLDRRRVAGQLVANFPGDLTLQLEQLIDQGELLPLIQLIDPSADRLIAQPSATRLGDFCRLLAEEARAADKQAAAIEAQPTLQRFQNLLALTKQTLGFQAIYLLIDGVDAYVEATTGQRRRLSDFLTPLLQQTSRWADEQLFVKYFLPLDLLQAVKFAEMIQPGTITDLKLVSIEWNGISLNAVLQERLRFASEGRFTNLDAICAPTLRGVQEKLIEVAGPLPREVLALAEHLLMAHVARLEEPALLEPVDLQNAIAHYQQAKRRREVAA